VTVLAFPGGGVCLDTFRTDEAPTRTTRYCECGHVKDERGNCGSCESVAVNSESPLDRIRAEKARWASEQEIRENLAQSESLLFHVLTRSRSAYWRTHADAARQAVTKAINALNESGFEDSPPCEVPR
jgi:hypothetical protein